MRRVIAVCIATLMTAACTNTGGTGTPGNSESQAAPSASMQAGSVAPLSQAAPVARISVEDGDGRLVALDDGIYAASAVGVFRIDPDENEARLVVDREFGEWGFSAGFGSAWVSKDPGEHLAGYVERWDLASGTLEATIEVGERPIESISAFGSIWVPNHHDSTVSRIDPATNQVAATITVNDGYADPVGLAAGDQLIWVSSGPYGNVVSGIDPATDEVVVELETSACWVAEVAGIVWARSCDTDLSRLFAASGGDEVGRTHVDVPVTDGAHHWVVSADEDHDTVGVYVLDLESLTRGPGVDIGLQEHANVLIAFDALWVSVGDEVLRYTLDDLP